MATRGPEAGFKTILEKLKVFDQQAKERYTKNTQYLRLGESRFDLVGGEIGHGSS